MTPPFETSARLAALGVAHGFFGRQGGLSGGDFASLNTSESSGDDRDVVRANRQRIIDALGFARLATLTQTHSNRVVTLTGDADQAEERPDADALVTDRPGVLLGILTADCTPIAFADAGAGVVGIAHAGWKGAVDGIAENTIAAMEALGASRERIVAAIGPTISGANYEVGPQFAADLRARNPATSAHILVPEGGREHFDLPGFLLERLRAAGVAVDVAGSCTYGSPERYFSHRFATHRGTKAGRQMSVIGLL